MNHYDIAIIGGGLVGLSLAILLRDTRLKVILIDAREQLKPDHRLFALTAQSCQSLKQLGLAEVLAQHATPIHEVHVSSRGHFGSLRLNRSILHLDALGHVIPAHCVESALHDQASQLSHCDFYQPAKLIKLKQDDHQVNFSIEHNHTTLDLSSSILIGADGAHSTVRQELGCNTQITDYKQSALVTRTELQRSHQHIAYERFYRGGAIAMLPLQEQQCATIWSASHEVINKLLQLDLNEFTQQLQRYFGYRLGRLDNHAARFCFPLKKIAAQSQVHGRVLLIGNAAHTVHPIAAQGFNLALEEVITLAQAINSHSTTLNATELNMLAANFKQKQSYRIHSTDYLARYASTSFSALHTFFALGLSAVDKCSFVKQKILSRFMT